MNWYAMTHGEKQEIYDRMRARYGITSLDLLHEAAILEHFGMDIEIARLAPPAEASGQELVEILYVPGAERAGISWGSDAVWMDAGSIDDAYDKFFNFRD